MIGAGCGCASGGVTGATAPPGGCCKVRVVFTNGSGDMVAGRGFLEGGRSGG